jgi:hypothetical protein
MQLPFLGIKTFEEGTTNLAYQGEGVFCLRNTRKMMQTPKIKFLHSSHCDWMNREVGFKPVGSDHIVDEKM